MTNLYSDRWINVSYIISNSVHGNILNKMFTIKKYICQRSAHADNCFKHKNEQKQSDIGFQLIRSDRPWEEMSNLGRKGRERNQRQNQIKSSQWASERNISTVFAEMFSDDADSEKTSTGPAADQWIVQKTAVWQSWDSTL